MEPAASARGPSRIGFGLLGALGAGIVLRLLGLGRGIWLDEYLSIALVRGDDLFAALRRSDHPPLYFLLLEPWSWVSARVEWLRLLSVLFGSGAIVVTVLSLRRRSALAALLAGALWATLPLFLRYSQEIRGYGLLLLLGALVYAAAQRCVERPADGRARALLALGMVAAVLVHAVGVMLALSAALYVLVARGAPDRRQLRHWLVLPAAPLACFALWFGLFLQPEGRTASSEWLPALTPALLRDVCERLVGLRELGLPLRALAERGGLPARALELGALATGALLGLAVLVRGDWRRSGPLLLAALAYWSLLLATSVLITPVVWHRTALPGMVPFISFVALHTASARPLLLRRAAAGALLLACATHACWWALRESGRPIEHWREAALALEARRAPNDLVAAFPPYLSGPLDYYARLPQERWMRWESPQQAERELEQLAQRSTGTVSQPGVWLLERRDLAYERDRARHEELRALLEGRYGPPAETERLGLLSLMRYGR